MNLDPAKRYADIRPETGRVMAIITGLDSIPERFMKRRLVVEILNDDIVNEGDIYVGKNAFTSPPPIQPVTEHMWKLIQQRRDYTKMSGIRVNISGIDKWFHSDDASRIQHLGLVIMGAAMPGGILWKTMDGSFITMTPLIAGDIFNAVAMLDMAAFAAAESHRVAMLASEVPGAYNFSTGWPVTYL